MIFVRRWNDLSLSQRSIFLLPLSPLLVIVPIFMLVPYGLSIVVNFMTTIGYLVTGDESFNRQVEKSS